MSEPTDETRDELRELDQRIQEVTRDIDGLREQLTEGGPLEPEESAAVLTNREELEGVLDGLRRRRETLQKRLDGR